MFMKKFNGGVRYTVLHLLVLMAPKRCLRVHLALAGITATHRFLFTTLISCASDVLVFSSNHFSIAVPSSVHINT